MKKTISLNAFLSNADRTDVSSVNTRYARTRVRMTRACERVKRNTASVTTANDYFLKYLLTRSTYEQSF